MRLGISLALLFALATLVATPALAQVPTPYALPASATVTAIIRVDITDNGEEGINFGSLTPGTTFGPELAQSSYQGAVAITVGKETNVALSLRVRAARNFTNGTKQISLEKAYFATSNDGTKQQMQTSATEIQAVNPSGADVTVSVWHFLGVPADAAPGVYSTTYYYDVAQL